MLFNVDTGRRISQVPYKEKYDELAERLSESELEAIFSEINRQVEGEEVSAANIIAGFNWEGTEFQPIYEKACKCDYDLSAKLLGQLVCKVLIGREDDWSLGIYRGELKGANYFRIDKPKD